MWLTTSIPVPNPRRHQGHAEIPLGMRTFRLSLSTLTSSAPPLPSHALAVSNHRSGTSCSEHRWSHAMAPFPRVIDEPHTPVPRVTSYEVVGAGYGSQRHPISAHAMVTAEG